MIRVEIAVQIEEGNRIHGSTCFSLTDNKLEGLPNCVHSNRI